MMKEVDEQKTAEMMLMVARMKRLERGQGAEELAELQRKLKEAEDVQVAMTLTLTLTLTLTRTLTLTLTLTLILTLILTRTLSLILTRTLTMTVTLALKQVLNADRDAVARGLVPTLGDGRSDKTKAATQRDTDTTSMSSLQVRG